MLKKHRKMQQKNVSVIFDRKGVAEKKGRGKVEIRVYLDRNVRKYIVVGSTTKAGWKTYQHSRELELQLEHYEEIVRAMRILAILIRVMFYNFIELQNASVLLDALVIVPYSYFCTLSCVVEPTVKGSDIGRSEVSYCLDLTIGH